MGALVKMAVLGGLGFGAYKLGLLDELLPAAAASQADKDAVFAAGNGALSALQELVQGDDESAGTGGLFGGLFDFGSSEELTTEEQYLEDYWDEVQPWARRNKTWVAAMMWQESKGNERATSIAGARGLMQVMPGTMGDIVRWGYTDHGNNPNSLYLPAPAIYFGTAYLQYLSGLNSDRDWITRAYNAGPGGQRKDGTWPTQTVNYLASIKAHYAELTEG